jgi:hypothetical protein
MYRTEMTMKKIRKKGKIKIHEPASKNIKYKKI